MQKCKGQFSLKFLLYYRWFIIQCVTHCGNQEFCVHELFPKNTLKLFSVFAESHYIRKTFWRENSNYFFRKIGVVSPSGMKFLYLFVKILLCGFSLAYCAKKPQSMFFCDFISFKWKLTNGKKVGYASNEATTTLEYCKFCGFPL